MQHLLSVDDLSTVLFTRRGAVEAVRGVSFEVAQAETVGLVGESGCGKTMTALSIMGLLPSTGKIMGGQVVLKGRDLSGITERQISRIRGREMAMIFQDPMTSLNPVLTVGEQVSEAIALHQNLTKHEVLEKVIDYFSLVSLPNPRDRVENYPHQLSGGMRQRVSICRALIHDPGLLLMDEPFGALDAFTREKMNVELLRIWRETKKTIIFVTHNIMESAFLADRVVVMTPRPGRVAKIVEININRPRKLAIQTTDEFGSYATAIRKCIDESVKGQLFS